jgi:UDP-glucose 4-epimerase
MRILVTGGFGFLGSYICKVLFEVDKDLRIHVIDNLSTNPMSLQETLDFINGKDRLTFEIVDLQDSKVFRTKNHHFSHIYHLASFVGPVGVLKHGGRMIQGMVRDAYSIIDLSISQNAKLLFASSSEIYGGGYKGLCREDTPRIVPAQTSIRLEYAVGKIAVETALLNCSKTEGLRPVIIRPFNVSGPRQSGKGGFALPRFIASAMLDKPIPVFGDGSALRAFTHVEDIAHGCILAMKSSGVGEIFNLGNPNNKTTILSLAERVRERVNPSSKIELVNPKSLFGPSYEEASDKFPDATKAIRVLGWSPAHDLDDIISSTLEYMQSLNADALEQLSGFSV